MIPDATSSSLRSLGGATDLVSIIVPVFNAENYLGECLESICAQSHRETEILAIDDGSTDRSLAILHEWAGRDSRLRVMQNCANLGVSVTRNRGILDATGEYLCFFDADDVMLPESISLRLQALQESPEVDVVYADGAYVDRTGYRLSPAPAKALDEAPLNELYRSPGMALPVVMLRTASLARVGLFDVSLTHFEDWDLWLRCAQAGFRFKGLKAEVYQYRQHEANSSRSWRKAWRSGVRFVSKSRPAERKFRRSWSLGVQAIARGVLDSAQATEGAVAVLVEACRHPVLAWPLLSAVVKHCGKAVLASLGGSRDARRTRSVDESGHTGDMARASSKC